MIGIGSWAVFLSLFGGDCIMKLCKINVVIQPSNTGGYIEPHRIKHSWAISLKLTFGIHNYFAGRL